MTIENTLAKVDTDLAAGRLPVARQRLRGLVSSFPADLSLRVRLADVYRLFGESAQAGRWSYLDAGRSPEEVAAFEARYRHPADRMRALAWRGSEAAAETPFARAQLAAIRLAASQSSGKPADWDQAGSGADEPTEPGSVHDSLFGLGCMAGLIVCLALMCLGISTVISWW
ncbi:DUF6584 family protein [Streptomyces sp. NPDC060064]|uniref:DUF6584 family protein n=1 Tax=Streptomyces sp. NPDC060064 TaxID=3347049 RepID=UPI00368724AE